MPIEPQSIPLYAGGPPHADRIFLQNLGASQEFVNQATWRESGDTSATTWLGRTLQQSPFGSDQDSPLLPADVARQKQQHEGVTFDVPETGMREQTFQTMVERQKNKRAYQEAIAAGPDGFAAGAQQFGIGLARQAIDPLNLAAAFIPVVGEARMAMMLEAAGTSWLARTGVMARVGAIEGTVGTAALEPGMHFMARQLQEDYTMTDSLLNIAFGGIIGGGLHIGVGAIKDWRAARGVGEDVIPHVGEVPARGEVPERVAALSPEARVELGRIALSQALSGREVDVASALDLAEITQRATDQERTPGFLRTAEDLLAQRQEDRMRATPGFLQSALDKLALRELDAERQLVQTRIDERIQGEIQTKLDQTESARGAELYRQLQSQPPDVTAKNLADLMEAQQIRGEILADTARMTLLAKERDLTVKELKEKIERMQQAGANDLAIYRKAGIPTEQIAQIQSARTQAAERVYQTAKAGQEPDAGIPHDLRALSTEADQMVKDAAVPEGEKASAGAMKDVQDATKELDALLKAQESTVKSETLFPAEDAAITQAKDEGKILKALASCRLRNE
jgi:hypothetical protein